MLLSIIVVAFMDEALQQLRYSSLYQNQDDLRHEAYASLEATVATLAAFQEVEEHLWGPAQGWSKPLEFAHYEPKNGVTIEVRLVEESSRLPLNSLDYDQLVALFTYLGIPDYLANDAADSLLDWGDDDDLKRLNGFDGEDYKRLDPPIRAANRKPREWAELELIPAMREAFWMDEERISPAWAQLKRMASLRYEGPVNINTAPAEVLYALEELQVLDAREIVDYRDGWDDDDTEDDRYYRDIGNASVTETSMASIEVGQLWVEVIATRGDAQFALTTLLQIGSSSGNNNSNRNGDGENGGDGGEDVGRGGDGDRQGQDGQQGDDQQGGQQGRQGQEGRQDTEGESDRSTQNTSQQQSERFPFQIIRLRENTKIGWTAETAGNFNDRLE